MPLSALAETKDEEKEQGSRRASSDSMPAGKMGAGAKDSKDSKDEKEEKDSEWED